MDTIIFNYLIINMISLLAVLIIFIFHSNTIQLGHFINIEGLLLKVDKIQLVLHDGYINVLIYGIPTDMKDIEVDTISESSVIKIKNHKFNIAFKIKINSINIVYTHKYITVHISNNSLNNHKELYTGLNNTIL